MNKLDKDYCNLLQDILDNGVTKQDRTGTGTISVFGRQIRHSMKDGFPILTTKKMAWKQIVTELLWFLRGDTNIKYLVDNDCHIWDGDCFANYQKEYKKLYYHTAQMGKEEFIDKIKTDDEFAKKWGELGPIYGKQWRSWGRKNVANYDLKDVKGFDQPKVLEAIKNGEDVTKYGVKIEYQNNSIDQIQNLINELKTNPDSRRLMVSSWNVGELDQCVLPPCHFSFQCYSHKKEGKRYLSLAWNQRSCDVGLGIPFNIASYGLLLEIIAKEVGMIPYELIGNLGDCHIYNNHIDGLKEQLNRSPYPLPKLLFKDHLNDFNSIVDILRVNDFILDNYQSHSPIKLPLSN